VRPDQYAALQEIAEKQGGLTVSEWARGILLEAAGLDNSKKKMLA
jgi:hypothetical protein